MQFPTVALLAMLVVGAMAAPLRANMLESWHSRIASADARHTYAPLTVSNHSRPAPVVWLDGGDPPPDPYAPDSTVHV